MADFKQPPAIWVYVTLAPDAKKGISKPYTGRVGTCSDEAGVAKIIADDRRAMGETFGGLIAPVSTKGRTYRAFRAEWTEIKL